MNGRSMGLLVGVALGFAAYFGGFAAFLLVGSLGAVGWGVGAWLDREGAAHLRDLFDRDRR
ncbi:hypothetical protein JHN55_34275 [Streptomyces sp. MBT56]|nr:hypothetical protein [Streptomyces sp. MBT56]MBK3606949.1 hypothetical protein [Streptomyces sp. MBT54]MBK3619477.1 hypothetical protein [Streptomyces sp. MBT98]MBK6047004.1 hypothetical protein [Streptomyces sp. MBT55]